MRKCETHSHLLKPPPFPPFANKAMLRPALRLRLCSVPTSVRQRVGFPTPRLQGESKGTLAIDCFALDLPCRSCAVTFSTSHLLACTAPAVGAARAVARVASRRRPGAPATPTDRNRANTRRSAINAWGPWRAVRCAVWRWGGGQWWGMVPVCRQPDFAR